MFDDYAARKSAEAITAVLPPYITDAGLTTPGLVAIGNAWSRTLFDGDFLLSPAPDQRRPACSLVFVQSRDGNTGARDPSALGGGDTDKHLIYEGLSRVAADAVMAGAETVRSGAVVFSVWHPELVRLREALKKPRHPIQIVATLRGLDLERGLMFNTPEINVILLTVRSCRDAMAAALTARPWISVIDMDHSAQLPAALERLRPLGIHRVSCIGGRRIATQLLDERLVQDVYLTTAPRAGGEPHTPMYPGALNAELVVRKRGTGVERGVTFEHFRPLVKQ